MEPSQELKMLIAKGDAEHLRGNLEGARSHFEQALAIDPGCAKALRGLSLLAVARGAQHDAIDLLRRAVAIDDTRAPWLFDLGSMLVDVGRTPEAIVSMRRATELDPSDASYAGSLALALRRVRQEEEAIAEAHRAIGLDPTEHNAHLTLAQHGIKAGALDDAEAHLQVILDRPLDMGVRAIAWHHLGQVEERRERWDAAWDAHMKGNEMMLASQVAQRQLQVPLPPFEPFLNYAEQFKVWGAKRYADDVPPPIVLAGFPRSGTTMVEQILAAHPALATSEERPITAPVRREMVAMMRQNKQTNPTGDDMIGLTDDQVVRLRRIYRDALENAIDDESHRDRILIDKGPLRTLDLGLFNRFFPESKIILMIRDPRDVVLSGIFQHFAINQALVRFLTPELGAGLYETVMGHYLKIRSMLTISVLPVRYEDVVTDFDTWAPRILEFVGVDWDDRVRDFHEFASKRAVRSASYESVTQKINTRAVGKWLRYADRLAPILPTLEPFVEAFGYQPSAEAIAEYRGA